jgi:large subunit ribosomal protein L17
MPQPKKGPRLGSNPKHQDLMLRNLARSLFQHERIRTTEAKAKMLRPYAEKLITKAKKGSVHDRRQVLSAIEDREVVHKLFADIGPRFSDRNGGYTRVLKLGPRFGDSAPMALIELVEEGGVATVVGDDETAQRRRRGLRRPPRPKAEPEAAEAGPEDDLDEAEAGERGETPGDADSETSQDQPADPEAEPEAIAEPAAARESANQEDESAPAIEAGATEGVTDQAEATPDTGAKGKGSADQGRAPGKKKR